MAVHHDGTAMTPKTAKQLADEEFFAARSDTMTTIRVFERSEQPQTMFGLLNKTAGNQNVAGHFCTKTAFTPFQPFLNRPSNGRTEWIFTSFSLLLLFFYF